VTLFDDLRQARRALGAQPLLAVSAVAILAVAIGANTAVFALVNATLLSPLPFRDPDRLVVVDQARGNAREPLSLPDYRDLRDRNRGFDELAASFQWSANLTGGEPERVQGMRASASFFEMLGTPTALGRTLVPDDERGSGRHVAVLTHGFWMRRFGGAPEVLGSTLSLNGDAYTIVGVLPDRFVLPVRDADLVLPFPMDTDPRRTLRDAGFLKVVGRLKPGVTISQARADLDSIMARLRTDYPVTNATHTGTLVDEWHSMLVSKQRSLLILLQVAVGLVLVVACANVANLFLAASVRREHEFAVRAALGAGALRQIRQVFAEAAMIAAASAAGALLFMTITERTLQVLAPPDFLALSPPNVTNGRLLAFVIASSAVAALSFGLLPAVRLGAARGSAALRSSHGASAASRRFRDAMVASEVAVASALVIVAVLLSQSFARLQAVDAGVKIDHLLTVRLSLPRSRYPSAAPIQQFTERFRARLLALPGVTDAAAANVVPLNGYHATSDAWPADRPAPDPDKRLEVQYRMVSPAYLRTFGVPLLAGRDLGVTDDIRGQRVVLVSRTLADRFWSVGDAVGKSLMVDDGATPREMHVVGVVGDVKHYGLDAEVTPDVYVPIPQVPDATTQWLTNNMYWGVRTASDPAAIEDAVRRALREVDPDVPASSMRTMDEALAIALAPRRMNLWLVRAFALLALVLASAGTYAVTSFSVALRRREMAIRAALGARVGVNVRAVVLDAARPIAVGLTLGVIAALALGPVLRAVLFGVSPLAPAPFLLVSATLLGVALGASLIAALPVRRVSPIEALKVE
jgi:putative ABC transport system permease protein